MTGEMSWINPDGEAGDGNSYPLHAAVAKKLHAKLRPFDTYIGPYISTPQGRIFLSSDDGVVGTACLWRDGIAPAYREPITAEYVPADNPDEAIAAARAVLKSYRAQRNGHA